VRYNICKKKHGILRERSRKTKREVRDGEKKQGRARMVREVHRLYTPVQEAKKMHTGMTKVVLNHFSLYPTMLLLSCASKFHFWNL